MILKLKKNSEGDYGYNIELELGAWLFSTLPSSPDVSGKAGSVQAPRSREARAVFGAAWSPYDVHLATPKLLLLREVLLMPHMELGENLLKRCALGLLGRRQLKLKFFYGLESRVPSLEGVSSLGS